MHHIIPPPGCKQAPPVLNGALSSHGGSFIAPLRLCAPAAKLEFSKFSHQEIYNSLSSPLYARGKENRPPGPVFFPPQIMSQYRKNRRRRLTGESCSVNNIGVYILFMERGMLGENAKESRSFRFFVSGGRSDHRKRNFPLYPSQRKAHRLRRAAARCAGRIHR